MRKGLLLTVVFCVSCCATSLSDPVISVDTPAYIKTSGKMAASGRLEAGTVVDTDWREIELFGNTYYYVRTGERNVYVPCTVVEDDGIVHKYEVESETEVQAQPSIEERLSEIDAEIKRLQEERKSLLLQSSSVDVTTGMKNALRSALDYLEYSAFSRNGLIKQLEYEGYSNDEAVYAVDNCGADWFEQAYKSALEYLDYSSFSKDGLMHQLEYEGFSAEEAQYGADAAY